MKNRKELFMVTTQVMLLEKSKDIKDQPETNLGLISCIKNVSQAPWYANIVTNENNGGFHYNYGGRLERRYPITWRLREYKKLFTSLNPTYNNSVTFTTDCVYGGCSRLIGAWGNGDGEVDNEYEAFAYLYYPSTQELHCHGLYAREEFLSREGAGGIVIIPMPSCYLHIHRHQYLMDRWRRLTPLIGKWVLFLKNLYTEVTYRPGNQGAQYVALEFQAYMQQY